MTKPRTRRYVEHQTKIRVEDAWFIFKETAESGKPAVCEVQHGLRLKASTDGALSWCFAFIATGAKGMRRRLHAYRGTVRTETAPCFFGGSRRFFLCPITGQRVTALYWNYKRRQFVSREAAGLHYKCQSEDKAARLERKAAKIMRPLEEDGSRPSGMHQKTYAAAFKKLKAVGRELKKLETQ